MSKRISAAAMVHLENELGPELARELFNPSNVGEVRDCLERIIIRKFENKKLQIGGRAYIPTSPTIGEWSLNGQKLVERAQEFDSHSGEEDAAHFLKHQNDIPTQLRGRVIFVFTNYIKPDEGELYCIVWEKNRWVGRWDMIDTDEWHDNDWVLKREV